jgi:hypothetical protein
MIKSGLPSVHSVGPENLRSGGMSAGLPVRWCRPRRRTSRFLLAERRLSLVLDADVPFNEPRRHGLASVGRVHERRPLVTARIRPRIR